MNVEETNIVIFHSTHISLNDSFHIKIGNQPVQRAKYVKILVVLLDENLRWKFHL